MQGAASAPAAPAAEPPAGFPDSEHIKTKESVIEEKLAMILSRKISDVKTETHEPIPARTMSIDSDNKSDGSEDDCRRARKRALSTSPTPSDHKRQALDVACPLRHTPHVDTRSIHSDASAMDFSNKKFTDEARGYCERSPHRPIAEARYRCPTCSREFDFERTLDMHRKICGVKTHVSSPDRDGREDFFTNLNLRNRFGFADNLITPPNERFVKKFDDSHFNSNGIRHVEPPRDLADIQSILTVTSAGSILDSLANTRVMLGNTVLTPPDTIAKDRDQEESQDNFAAEFRRMKLRGEFPCRLCPAKFPNLRALKGHNRVHLNGTGPGPYQCNMCPHASLDKAALMRHMRTHNGDRPYECAVCNYAFTTKANCERHLRNRHAKVTREDVKNSIIYHPSEDPNNDEVNSKMAREEVKRSLAFHTPDVERRNDTAGRDTPLSHFAPNFINDIHAVSSLSSSKPVLESPPLMPMREVEHLPRIKVKGIGQLKQIPEYVQEVKLDSTTPEIYDDETPVDLSTNDNNNDYDVLDLSKKSRSVEEEPKIPTRPSFEPDPVTAAATAFQKAQSLLAQQSVFGNPVPKFDAAYYATQLSHLYVNSIPTLPGISLPNYFLSPPFFPHPSDTPEVIEVKRRMHKDLILGLSMSGGRIIGGDLENNIKPEEEDQKPQPPATPPAPQFRAESPRPINPTIVSPNDSVKMVIKNGVLMPKQKQRRYRTERPFSCSQCSARFTLRSNMERHVKQQHPQHWTVRRPTTRPPPSYPSESLDDRLKYALLARHLERPLELSERSPIRRDSDDAADNEEDEEDALIIDEELEESEKKSEDHSAAHRAAAEILMATKVLETQKDIEVKITGNLISKPLAIPVEKDDELDNRLSKDEPPPVAIVTRSDEEEDEEGLVASTSEGNNSGSDENRSECDNGTLPPKKKSAYSLAPNRVSCPYCHRKFPWSSSLRRHVLTHTGQKPFKCPHCPLLFTTKSNCDRHLLRKHGGSAKAILAEPITDNIQAPIDARTVSERPFKCTSCTGTFSTMDALKKHTASRHGTGDSRPDSPVQEEDTERLHTEGLAFKCHLCDASFGDRSGALAHLAHSHAADYDQLVSKGALDAASDRSESADDDERGKFPDHANRKVVCAFCVRRFWSAEDLRRHMRTHSGERPFVCDLCRRRFTLKHSMLRHRKKHGQEATTDEEGTPPHTPREEDVPLNGYNYREDEGSGGDVPANVNNNNSPPAVHYDKQIKLQMASRKYSSDADNDTDNGGDLIGKLLGISDKTINKLLSSPDAAAQLLGVNK